MFGGFFRSIAAATVLFSAGTAQAQDACDVTHKVVDGESAFSLAERYYGDTLKWSLIYYANQGVISNDPSRLTAGLELFIPCLAADQKAEATPLLDQSAELRFLTGSAYPPFSDKEWPGGGMITELVNALMEETPNPVTFAVDWQDDWSQHLFPILDEAKADMGFPWLKPDCSADPSNERCANFHFSDPLFVLPIQLFVRTGSDIVFNEDADIEGLTLCRPKGYYTHDLDANGRNWLSEAKITLVQLDSPDACFTALANEEVDAVPENLFLGADRIVALNLRGKVGPLERPLSNETLHVIVSKKHWRGTTFLFRVNAGLKKIQENGRYEEIVNKHLGIFMAKLKP